MSAIAPREYDEPAPRSERPRGERQTRGERPENPAMKRFAFMWDGWHSIEVEDNFVLA